MRSWELISEAMACQGLEAIYGHIRAGIDMDWWLCLLAGLVDRDRFRLSQTVHVVCKKSLV